MGVLDVLSDNPELWAQAALTTTTPVRSPARIARNAFDAAAAVTRAESLADLDAEMRKGAAPLGFTTVSFGELENGRFAFLAGNPPEAFLKQLVASGRMNQDVVFRATIERRAPFFWTEVTAQPGLTAIQRQIIAERAAFGFREGFTSGLRDQRGRVTFVTMAGFDIDSANPDVRAATRVLADCYSLAARRLTSADLSPQVALTARQIDCLRWVRAGKSAADIGAILGISAHTAQEHITDACARLGVRTRVQAVVAALSMNLLSA